MFETSPTPEKTKQGILQDVDHSVSRLTGSFADTIAGGAALEIWKVDRSLEQVTHLIDLSIDSPPAIIESECSNYGIYRKNGARATAQLTIKGQDGTVLVKGKIFLTTSGLEYHSLHQAVILAGSASIQVEAAEAGTLYNQPAGCVVIQMETQTGVTAVEAGAATGGADMETIESLLGRYHLYLQKPLTSANANQYIVWASAVDGVGDALIRPLIDGPGTVGVTLVSPAMLPVDDTTVQRCKAHIETRRPADAIDVLVDSATGVAVSAAAAVRLSISVTAQAVSKLLKEALTQYCRESVALKNAKPPYTTELPYSKVGYLLLGIDGVEDYSNLKVNGGTQNIIFTAGQVPVVGEVFLT